MDTVIGTLVGIVVFALAFTIIYGNAYLIGLCLKKTGLLNIREGDEPILGGALVASGLFIIYIGFLIGKALGF